jgi:hypothetical protein
MFEKDVEITKREREREVVGGCMGSMLEILCEKGLPGERGERKSLTKADIRKISSELLTFIVWVEAPYLIRDRDNISFAFFHLRHPCLMTILR